MGWEAIAVGGDARGDLFRLEHLIDGAEYALAGTKRVLKFADQEIQTGPLVRAFEMPPHQRAAAGLGRTFQNIRLFRSMTALENVEIGAERRGNTMIGKGGDAALTERAMEALTFVGLGARANELIPSFSYGHQRLIEIARALAANPTLLLLDEPAAGLNSTEKLDLHELLKRIAALGLTILIIDHDMTLVSEAAQHITVLNFGRRIADGESMAVLRHPDVVSAYLGSE